MVFFSELERDDYKALRLGKPDTEAVSPLREAIKSELKAAISSMIASVLKEKLHQRSQLVLTLRYGLDNKGERTLEEVAEQLKVTRERVRQIQKKALQRLAIPAVRRIVGSSSEADEAKEQATTEQPITKRKYRRRKGKRRKKQR